MEDLQDVGALLGDHRGESCQRAGDVAQEDPQADEAAVFHEAALDDPREHGDVDVAARENQGHAAALEVEAPVEQGGQRRGARALDDRLFDLEQEQHRVGQLLLVHRHHAIHPLAGEGERQLADLAHGDAVGDRRAGVHAQPLAALERARHRRQRGRLHADHADVGPLGLDGQRHTADESPAADGDEHGLDVGQLLEQLEPERALAGDHARIVERMDEELAALGAQRPRQLVGVVVVASIQDHLGAVASRRRDFDERRVLGHDDRGRDAEPLGVERDGETVVTGAGGDDARAPRIGAQLEQEVGGAALLERARHLEVLELHETARAGELGEGLRVCAGRLDDGVAEPEPGGLDGGDVDGAGQSVHQNGSAGSPSVGVIQPTGMSGVECA